MIDWFDPRTFRIGAIPASAEAALARGHQQELGAPLAARSVLSSIALEPRSRKAPFATPIPSLGLHRRNQWHSRFHRPDHRFIGNEIEELLHPAASPVSKAGL